MFTTSMVENRMKYGRDIDEAIQKIDSIIITLMVSFSCCLCMLDSCPICIVFVLCETFGEITIPISMKINS